MKLLLVISLLFVSVAVAEANIINAASPNFIDVSNAVQLANNGDTVVIPAGTADWTNSIVYTKDITLQGAGVGQTIIMDDHTWDFGMFRITSVPGYVQRITGITFTNGLSTTHNYSGLILFYGTNFTTRIDHCAAWNLQTLFVDVDGWTYGVMDHNVGAVTNNNFFVVIRNGDSYGGYQYGDGAWADSAFYGTSNFFFVEDNTAWDEQTNGLVHHSFSDAELGSRYVIRHNTMTNLDIANHGTESGARDRGSRACEVYSNYMVTVPGGTVGNAISFRSGTGVVWGNTTLNFSHYGWTLLEYYRSGECFTWGTSPYGWGGASGESTYGFWDTNDSHGVYWSGTATTGSGLNKVVVSGANWTTNQWVGYTLVDTNTSQWSLYSGSTSSTNFLWIFTTINANTSNTLTLDGCKDFNFTANSGDSVFIYHVLQGLDMTGAGKGDQLNGYVPTTNMVTGIASWPHQAIEPVYAWSNSVDGSFTAATMSSGTAMEVEGVHFTNQTVMPGYTPYVYPHPLTGTITTNLSASYSPANPTNGNTLTFSLYVQTNAVTVTAESGTDTIFINGVSLAKFSSTSGVGTYAISTLAAGTYSMIYSNNGTYGTNVITGSLVVYSNTATAVVIPGTASANNVLMTGVSFVTAQPRTYYFTTNANGWLDVTNFMAGTISFPLDGSTPANLSFNMSKVPAGYPVHLLSGTYTYTNQIVLPTGSTVEGDGMTATILQAGATNLVSSWNVRGTNITLQNLTIDGHYQAGTNITIDGAILYGNSCTMSHVRFINGASFNASYAEAFGLFVSGGAYAIIHDCVVSNYTCNHGTGWNNLSAIGVTQGDYASLYNNTVIETNGNPVFAYGIIGNYGTISNCTANGCAYGYHSDTVGGATNLLLVANLFTNCAEDVDFANSVSYNLTFLSNSMSIYNTNASYGSYGITLENSGSYSNVVAGGNLFVLTPTFTGGPVLTYAWNVNGLIETNNRVSSSLTNILTSCSNVSVTNNVDQNGNPYNP